MVADSTGQVEAEHAAEHDGHCRHGEVAGEGERQDEEDDVVLDLVAVGQVAEVVAVGDLAESIGTGDRHFGILQEK